MSIIWQKALVMSEFTPTFYLDDKNKQSVRNQMLPDKLTLESVLSFESLPPCIPLYGTLDLGQSLLK